MDKLIWQPEYSTGQEEVDLQHRYFISLINRLDGELNDHGDRDYQKNLLWELKKYTDFHFQSEENLMHKAHLADLDSHKHKHQELTGALAEKIQGCVWRVNPPDGIVAFLVGWFITHTLEEDKKSWSKQETMVT